ncbi:DNA-processing protein DprA [Sutcliffiella rhizosphaerae]|uniref:DNA processing protein DprA n=1 Tax=Sutcliffiella rhizosphaerae TaxID=2880967 RepID=A0ABM8YUN8_9BACI|nr:DNA-processing protein DprA [Sutcliffiella rhizosphaerae]CAG9623685.1 DNA processing protein DprA [Sutcliffiella rhizosphaerae]
MTKKIRSDLFFLKQYGFNDSLLQTIFQLSLDPIKSIFNNENELIMEIESMFTEKDRELARDYQKYKSFKFELFNTETFFKDSSSKIYFKYDQNDLTAVIPEKIMPLFMYSKGDVAQLSLDKKRVAIVGTRKPSEKSIELTKKITQEYVHNNYIIVSGLAEGIDTVSHETTLSLGGKTIAVLPTNFNEIYPKTNQDLANFISEEGLLLTAIGPKENTYKSSFLDRNKYVANISNLVIIIETNLKSGTMNTIRNAFESNKKILFVDQGDEAINNKIFEFGGEMLNDK